MAVQRALMVGMTWGMLFLATACEDHVRVPAPHVAAQPLPASDTPGSGRSAGLNARFEAKGVRITPDRGDWQSSVRLVAYGCQGHDEPVAQVSPARDTSGKYAWYTHHGEAKLVEWYAQGSAGLEQGFTIEKSPCRGGAGRAWLETEAEGLLPDPLRDGLDGVDGNAEVVLRDRAGNRRVRYSNAFAVDETGRSLPIRLAVRRGRIALSVDLAGARFPVQVDPLIWAEQQELTATGGSTDDRFGTGVSLSGNTTLIGAFTKRVGTNAEQGAAYVFVRAAPDWKWTQQGPALVAADGLPGDWFGQSVALSGDTALIGAYGRDADQGSAYVFVRGGTTWSQQGPGWTPSSSSASRFGRSVALSGDTALVGAYGDSGYQGAVYVFVRSGTTWSEQARLVASDGLASDSFGYSVALSGDTAIVGASEKKVGANTGQGAAYVFVRSGTTWSQQGPALVASDGAAGNELGQAVALDGDTALVGDPYKPVGTNTEQGSAYVFVRTGTTWTQQGGPLLAADGAAGDLFGWSVAVSGDVAFVGAFNRGVGSRRYEGAAYVFARTGTTWAQQGSALVGSDGALGDGMGASIGLSSDTAVIGANNKSFGTNTNQGAAYSFVLVGAPCSVASDCLSGVCADGVCCDKPCTGSCDVCTVSLGAPADGVCAPAPAGYPGNAPCAPLACTGTSACGLCNADTDCTAPTYCAADGTCQPRKPVGAACDLTAGVDCRHPGCRACDGSGSGFCVDGVCCESQCGDECAVCAKAVGSSADGICDAAPKGTSSCLTGFLCDGTSTSCPTSCVSDADCEAAFYCSAAQTCVLRKPLGSACDPRAGIDCHEVGCRMCDGSQTGFCADGVCCDTACDGACDACAAAEGATADGTCTLSVRGSEGRPACANGSTCNGTSALCPGSCVADAECTGDAYCDSGGQCTARKIDGSACAAADECTSKRCVDGVCCGSACTGQCESCNESGSKGSCVPITGVPRGTRPACSPDATCSDGRFSAASECDVTGACSAPAPVACGNYACTAQGCLTACVQGADCSPGSVCSNGRCVTGTICEAGTCADSPDSGASGGPSATHDAGGCGCRVATRRSTPLPLASILALLLAFRQRNRTRRAHEQAPRRHRSRIH